MAVAIDAVSNTQTLGSNHTSQSDTHTTAGSDRFVVLILSYRDVTTNPTGFAATYDSVSMTELVSVQLAAGGVIIFGLANPNTTAGATAAMSWTSDCASSAMGTISFTGVQGGAGATDTDSSTSAQTTAISISGATADDFIVDGFGSAGGNAANDPTVGANQTRQYVESEGGFKAGGSTQDGTDGGDLEWDNIETDFVYHAGVLLLAAAAAVTQTKRQASVI